MSAPLTHHRSAPGDAGHFRAELVAPPGGDAEAESGWLLVYLDVMTLLLVLFIVLLSFAEPDARPTRALPSALLVPLPTATYAATPLPREAGPPTDADVALPEIASDRVQVIRESDRVSLRIQDSLLFGSARAELTGEGLSVLNELVPVLADHAGAISVEGHTDSMPVATPSFPSNWELSTARATEVLRYLESQGVPAARMRAVGRAATDPVAPNTNAPGRAANRRVDLIMHREVEP